MGYVVIVNEPLPDDLTQAAQRLSEEFGLPPERALRLLRRAPGPVTKAVPERDARNVAGVLGFAGLNVQVRQGSVDGPVMEWILPDLSDPRRAQRQPVTPDQLKLTHSDVGPLQAPPADQAPPVEPAPPVPVASPLEAPEAAPVPGPPPSPSGTVVPGSTITTPPRDPMKTTLERDPPKLDRGGLRRRVTTAATLPALLTLLVTLVALTVTLLPLLQADDERLAATAANSVAAAVEGLSNGLPLTAPLVRAQFARVAESTAQRLPAQGVDFLLLLDEEGAPLIAWYRGQLGLQQVPDGLLRNLEAHVRGDVAPAGVLADRWRQVLELTGLRDAQPQVASAVVTRAGAAAGLVLAGTEGRQARAGLGWALLTALLVGLIPVLFGVLAALSLSRGLRDAITYLLRATDSISLGDLERPVQLTRDDELGQIAHSVERMRVSLAEAMERLRRR